MKNQIKTMVKSNIAIAKVITCFPLNNQIKIQPFKKNKLNCCGFLFRSSIKVVGRENQIDIGREVRLHHVYIMIHGDKNHIIIKKGAAIRSCELVIEDQNGGIEIGEGTGLSGNVHLAAIEGKKIIIGNDCMFSANITIRVGDSHSIIQVENEKRINPSKDVVIGNHVWVGNQVTILKGVSIPDNCIIGTGSVVTKSIEKPNVIIAGNPARIVKQDISWCRERI